MSFSLVFSITGCKSIGVSDGGGSTYSISGAVTGADLAGLAGVTINLTGAATASTTTDASGNFTFSGLADGTYTVTPVKEGFTFTPPSLEKVVKGASVTGANFVATA
ncbi:MAG: carboxypeptidase-like regulatory domain-containing protein, partial [Chloroflexota bacterium]